MITTAFRRMSLSHARAELGTREAVARSKTDQPAKASSGEGFIVRHPTTFAGRPILKHQNSNESQSSMKQRQNAGQQMSSRRGPKTSRLGLMPRPGDWLADMWPLSRVGALWA